MSDINAALQNVSEKPFPSLPSPHEIAMEGVRRDQRRTRWLAILCLVFWLLAAAGMALLVTGLNEFVMGVRLNTFRHSMPRAASDAEIGNGERAANRETAEEQRTATPASRLAGSDDELIVWDYGTSLLHHSLPYIVGALAALLLAAFSTVLLVFSSRRTTLNKISVSLAQICEQIKSISQTHPGGAARGSEIK